MQITARPYNTNFSGNALVYAFYDADAVADAAKTFEVKLLVRRQTDSSFTELPVLPLVPVAGAAKIDLSTLVDAYLVHELPTLANATQVQASSNCSAEIYVQYRMVTAGAATQPPFNNSEADYLRRVFKGGIARRHALGNPEKVFFADNGLQLLATWHHVPGVPLMSQPPLVKPHHVLWLGWYNTRFVGLSGTNVTAEVQVTFTDSTTAATSFDVAVPGDGFVPDILPAYSLIYIPAGAQQLNLQALDANKTIYRWQIRLVQTGNAITDWYAYENDLRSDYNDVPLLVRNSLGGLDTVHIRGTIEEETAYDTEEINRSAAPGWEDATPIPFLQVTRSNGEQHIYRADIGYMPLHQQDALRDAFARREVYWINAGRYWPLNLLSKGLRLRSSEDFEFSVPIEFTLALPPEAYFTPAGVLALNTASTNVCGTTLAISNQSENVLSSTLSEWSFTYTHSGTAPNLQYRIVTLTSAWSTTPMGSQLVVTVPRPGVYQLQIRALCADGSTGPVITRGFEVGDGTPPPANNSQVVNNMSVACSFSLFNGGTPITAGDLEPTQTKGFYIADGVYTLTLTTAAFANVLTVLSSNGNIYGLDNCTIVNGCVITLNEDASGAGTN